MSEVTLGRIVVFVVDEHTRARMSGNADVCELPAVIVRVWSNNCVNLKVLCDGPEDLWVTSVSYDGAGMSKRTWHWPNYA